MANAVRFGFVIVITSRRYYISPHHTHTFRRCALFVCMIPKQAKNVVRVCLMCEHAGIALEKHTLQHICMGHTRSLASTIGCSENGLFSLPKINVCEANATHSELYAMEQSFFMAKELNITEQMRLCL